MFFVFFSLGLEFEEVWEERGSIGGTGLDPAEAGTYLNCFPPPKSQSETPQHAFSGRRPKTLEGGFAARKAGGAKILSGARNVIFRFFPVHANKERFLAEDKSDGTKFINAGGTGERSYCGPMEIERRR